MDEQRRKTLEGKGWKIGDAKDFLDLLIRTLLSLGASRHRIAALLSFQHPEKAAV